MIQLRMTAINDLAYSIRPGRDLRYSPRWPCSDSVVVFDAASGDYWVVTPIADAALRQLSAGAQSVEALMAIELSRPVKSAAYLRTILDGLVEAELLAV